ncbi:hypothetical protein HHK36_000861 [Tetracentron sinense]|uniref:TELO2-interacting protein 1 homolog n=1 Tax=Tetracentron sinense TaxID=13715 RepID=A0A834ZRS8_TETSI|nr:hypothetical protein HHK36_000861 [Tetracentron sinense]
MMEEIAEENGVFNTSDDEVLSSVFSHLKPCCLDLLDLLHNPKKNSTKISELLEYLQRTPGDALQPFLDYILFPLLLLLDAAVGCRSPQKVDSIEEFGMVKTPHTVSDRVAECVLLCLEELLKKCCLGSVNQESDNGVIRKMDASIGKISKRIEMVVVLKKLTNGALLSPSEAAEEFREGIIRCFKALLLSLHPCCVVSCTCKQVLGFPILIASNSLQIPPITPSKYHSKPEECLLAFLQSQNASAAVGHWLSLLLKSADTEATRGHRGSSKLRIEAFLTIRMLVAKVGTADALAFFLPGVVSQYAKVLRVSKMMVSGAAGSLEAIDQAIRGLAEFLMIVLEDDANLSCLDMSINGITGFSSNGDESTHSFLEALRHLPVNAQGQDETLAGDSKDQTASTVTPKFDYKEKSSTDSRNSIGSLYVERTKDWIEETTAHVDDLFCSTFPHLCVHPATKVRRGLLAAIRGLLSKCRYTLKKSRLMLLEYLCVLVCDDSEEVSLAAQEFLESLLTLGEKHLIEHEVAEIFSRLIEKLPKVLLGNEETITLSHAQRLLAVIYYSGPQLVVDHLLRSPLTEGQFNIVSIQYKFIFNILRLNNGYNFKHIPFPHHLLSEEVMGFDALVAVGDYCVYKEITAARFLDILAFCLSQNSVFAGSLDKLVLANPSSVGYLHSVAELKGDTRFSSSAQSIMGPSETSRVSDIENKEIQNPLEIVRNDFELPRMPPWFIYVGSQKLYQALAGILRLVGLSLMADPRREVSLSIVTDIPLGYLRKLVSEVRMKGYSKESWQSWYSRVGSGQLLRQASTAVCILNEMIFGISDQSVDIYARMFRKSRMKGEEIQGYDAGYGDGQPYKIEHAGFNESIWKVCQGKDSRSHLIDCVGSILHEYLSPEVWDLPIEQKSSLLELESEEEEITLHFFRDTAMLHQEIFSDSVLRILSASSGYPTVGCLVVANADYIIDSLCRQLRHLDLNPHVPNVLAAMLSYIGVAHEILPLLEEPMRSVSLELEVLERHQHPDLTVPFLKAVSEIAKASKHDASAMPTQAESYSILVRSMMSDMEKKARKASRHSFSSHYSNDIDICPMESEEGDTVFNDINVHVEHWENILFKLNESKRYRRTVGSVAGSCLTAASPLLASVKEAACLVALDVVEDGIAALAKVEEAYRHERETIETTKRAIELCSFHNLQDTLDAADEGTDENRLLPAMNKIWPYLVVCVRNKNPVVVKRCLGVVSHVVQICGGDFFSRRFHNDGPHFWKLLTMSPFRKKPISRDGRTPLQLPYRSTTISSEDSSMAEVSSMKVQAAVLNMISDISRNKRSASALEVVLKKVSGLVVGIACSGVVGLCNASVNALSGLACIDPDLIWLLLADVYYSLKKKDIPIPPTSDLTEISHLLPPPLSPKGYLYTQYGGDSFGFDVDFSSLEMVFQKLHSEVFTKQMYT